jgi:hypothetical protein
VANARSGNTYYIDTQYATNEELTGQNLLVLGVLVTATAASAVLLLADSTVKKMDLRVATSGASQFFDFSSSPVRFNTSIRPTTLTNAVATIIIKDSQGG